MFDSLNAYSFIFVALNLVILYVVLRKILFKRVTDFMENRTNAIENSIKTAEQQKAEANELKLRHEQQLREARADGEKVLAEAIAKANRVADSIIAKARKDAGSIMQQAKQDIEHEREQMLKDIHNQIVDLTIEAASKVIAADLNTNKNLKLIQEFLDEEGAA